jgi:[protein-PII] uridylyltransferase
MNERTEREGFFALHRKLKEQRQAFSRFCAGDVPGVLAARTYAQTFLQVLQKGVRPLVPNERGWAFVAVGGFGRGELSFASDIDLLFLYHRRLPSFLEDLIRDLVYGLWDAEFEVGHVVTSVSGLRGLMREDFSAETTYLETRFIAGDPGFYADWRRALLKDYGRQRRRRFLDSLLRYCRGRLAQYGESSYLLEPHLKEGIGGLRDLHVARWAAMVFLGDGAFESMVRERWLSPEECHWLEQAQDFLWRVRLQLHGLVGRRQDQLLLGDQEPIALRLGFVDGTEGSAVEAFMRLYYRHTARIRRVTAFLMEKLQSEYGGGRKRKRRDRILPGPFLLEGEHLRFLEPDMIAKRPGILMQFFWQAAQSRAHFHHETGQLIRENLRHFTPEWCEHPEVLAQFFEILTHPEMAFPVLKVMMETGFLEAFLPEFAHVRYRVQHDVYHLYTVDEHLLRTVRELHRLNTHEDEGPLKPALAALFADLKHPRVLYLAALIHDIGKGFGKNHAERGAEMAREMAGRFHLSGEESDLLVYLVRRHLLLAETALKRDLSDEKPVVRCAAEVEDRERLRMLYLLTIADSMATGPGAWNTWRASLLRELYLKVDRILRRGELRMEDVRVRVAEIQRAVLALIADTTERSRVSRWLDALSFRYLLSQPADAVVRHYRMEQELRKTSLVLDARPLEGEMWEVSIACQDRPGLFALITGVLWVHGLNVLAADIFTRRWGVALDVLRVESLPDPLHTEEIWEKIRGDLAAALADQKHMERLAARESRPSLIRKRCVPTKKDRVVIDEDASDFYTVIEVYTWDRPGVLHAITRTLYEMDLSIQIAKIATPGAQVVDVFYVTDLEGNKILDTSIHDTVKHRLLEVLARC